jgi:hypothetical protein
MSKQQLYSPYVISRNHSVDKMRIQKDKKKGEGRFPIGQFEYRSVINFGSRTENCYQKVAAIQDTGVILNHPNVIKNASDKVTCKERLKEYGVPTPEYQLPKEVKLVGTAGITGLQLNYPIVAKLRRGSGGEGMSVINDNKELIAWYAETRNQQDYFLEEVFQPNMKKNYEYRVSVSPLLANKYVRYEWEETDEKGVKHNKSFTSKLGEIISLRKLIRQDAVDEKKFGRNIALGNSYFTRTFERTFQRKRKNSANAHMSIEKAVCIAIEACNACDLDFGAVDMIFDSESNQWTVLEINTAPSMGGEDQTLTVNRWIQASRMMLQEKKALQ